MNAFAALLFSLMLISAPSAFAIPEEKNVEFTLSPALLHDGEIQIAFEWISPSEFRKKDLAMMDLQKINASHPNNNQMVIAKLAFITQQPYESLTYAKMNTAKYITDMLNSVAIRQKASDSWFVTNKVKAYNIPFRVHFDFKFREISAADLDASVVRFIRDENSAFAGPGREHFLILDMTNFSQLIYRNYSIVYVKELGPKETLIYSGAISGIDIKSANGYFNYPPFANTKNTMMGNLRTQITHMAKSIQN